MASELRSFMFEGLPVRGALVRLTDAWQELLRRRGPDKGYPPSVRDLLGEMSAAAVLMQSGLKFDGALVMQVFGDGPVRLAVAEAGSDLTLRATAKVVGDVADDAGLQAMLNVHGQGRFAITLDPRGRQPGQQPYQGVVPLVGDRREPLAGLAEVLEHYMRQSEQLDTRLVLAADAQTAAGLLIQRLPVQGGSAAGVRPPQDDESAGQGFERIAMLASTLTRDELLALPPERVLHRLFWQETLRLFDPRTPRFACSCTRERVAGMLRSLGRQESEDLIAERGAVEVGCEFCGLEHRFDAVDVAALFTPSGLQPPSSGSLQ